MCAEKSSSVRRDGSREEMSLYCSQPSAFPPEAFSGHNASSGGIEEGKGMGKGSAEKRLPELYERFRGVNEGRCRSELADYKSFSPPRPGDSQ